METKDDSYAIKLENQLYDLAFLNTQLEQQLRELQQKYDALRGQFFNEKPVAALLREKELNGPLYRKN